MITIGIIGNGFVGGATQQLECKDINLLVYDIVPEKCKPVNLPFKDLKKCDLIFISVPTPMNIDGSCNLNIVKKVCNNLKNIDYPTEKIIIRSTVKPGTSDKLNCSFMPEFLTEKNYLNDFINNEYWFLGTHCHEVQNKFEILMNYAFKNRKIKSNKCVIVKPIEAEIIKYGRNNFLATKIAFFNEFYQICQKNNCDFEKVRNGITLDRRITDSHTMVPGHDGKFGFGGTCFPKDINSMINHMENDLKIKSYVLKNVNLRNIEYDRKEKDWEKDPRAFTKH